ncbi:MAG: hypothetical protein U9Q03_03730 [Patescibacteria group bacterium]|nr:hypothetical protein [Patescibacteria group bacterium]
MKKVYHGKSNRGRMRDYSKSRYGNPLFRQSRRGRGKSGIELSHVKLGAIAVLVVALLVLLSWYLFWSQTFRIENVEVIGASPDTEVVIRDIVNERSGKRRALVLPQASIFMFDREAATEDMRERFYFGALDIRKRLPDSLVIEISEKQVVATFLSEGRFMALDGDGHIVRNLTERETLMMQDLPEGMGAVVTGELGAESVDIDEISGEEPDSDEIRKNDNPNPLVLERKDAGGRLSPGDQVVSGEALQLILNAYTGLPDVTGSGVRWFSLDTLADTVDVHLKSEWNVYLTTLLPFDVQKERLALVLKEKIGERRAELEYVDLRYDERIFFRFEEVEE